MPAQQDFRGDLLIMEKEQKKLLLVAVSVGVFLLVTITAAVVILSPRTTAEAPAFALSHPEPARIMPLPVTVNENEIDVPVTEPPVDINIINDYGREEAVILGAPDRNDGDNIISIPIPSTAAVPHAPAAAPAGAREVAVVAPRQTPAQPAPARTPQPAAQRPAPAPTPAPAARAPTPARPQPTRTVHDFWVQTGAFSAIARAEDAREKLASKGITSIIENRQIDGRMWYRVRLGPYTSEREANFWLALVRTIDGFEESQVRQTIRQQ